jgi:hypothetical protein
MSIYLGVCWSCFCLWTVVVCYPAVIQVEDSLQADENDPWLVDFTKVSNKDD